MNAMLILVVIIVVMLLLLLFTRRQNNLDDGAYSQLRPFPPHNALSNQMGEAIESGRQLHVSLGQASLIGSASPTSIAAVQALRYLAREGCASGAPPLTTVGDGTLLPIAQTSLRHAYIETGQPDEYKPVMAQFVAAETDPYAFAGGISNVIQQNHAGGNVLMGRFGPEIAIAAEAGVRENLEQVIGTDDPLALAVATAVTDNVLVGEELFAAGAYLEGAPSQIASLKVQDILRAIISLTILGVAVYQLITG